MAFQSIPTEVLAQIFAELECSKDRSMVSKSCRRFQEIVEPFLYGEVMVCKGLLDYHRGLMNLG